VDIPVQPTTHLAPTCRRAPTRPHGHPPRRRHHQPPQPRQSGRELVTTRRRRTHSTHETSALTSRSRSSDCVAARGIGSGPRCRDSRCSQPRSQMFFAMKLSVRSRSAALSIGRYTGSCSSWFGPPQRITERVDALPHNAPSLSHSDRSGVRGAVAVHRRPTAAVDLHQHHQRSAWSTNERAANRGSSTSKPVWTATFRPVVMQHGSSSSAESRRAADGMESIAGRRRIDVLWALLRDNRTPATS
jgi:hypothetical protein